jgi:gamma-tubulin complex component 2
LLELALRDSSASGDPFKDSLKFQLSPKTLVSDLLCIMHVRQDYQGNDQGFVSPESFALGAGDGMGVTDNLTGLEAFTFDYEVKWPVSLVISRSSLKRYELLFRHLFKCRLTERVCARVPHSDAMLSDRDINALCLQVLTNTWLDDQYCKEIIQLSDASRVAAFALRQRMLNFVQSLQYYSMFEVRR